MHIYTKLYTQEEVCVCVCVCIASISYGRYYAYKTGIDFYGTILHNDIHTTKCPYRFMTLNNKSFGIVLYLYIPIHTHTHIYTNSYYFNGTDNCLRRFVFATLYPDLTISLYLSHTLSSRPRAYMHNLSPENSLATLALSDPKHGTDVKGHL